MSQRYRIKFTSNLTKQSGLYPKEFTDYDECLRACAILDAEMFEMAHTPEPPIKESAKSENAK